MTEPRYRTGRQLKAARVLACMEVGDLAFFAGVHRNTVMNWEAATAIPVDPEPAAVRRMRAALLEPGFVAPLEGSNIGVCVVPDAHPPGAAHVGTGIGIVHDAHQTREVA